MAQELTGAIRAVHLQRKASSLQRMGCGRDSPLQAAAPAVQADRLLSFAIVDRLEVLGAAIGKEGNTTASVEHRLARATARFWGNVRILRGHGHVGAKLRAWSGGPAASAAHGSAPWHLAQHVLKKLQRWEYNILRKMLRFRWKPGEGQALFMVRTARILETWFRRFRVQPLHIRILKNVFKSAWRERTLTPLGGANFLRAARIPHA